MKTVAMILGITGGVTGIIIVLLTPAFFDAASGWDSSGGDIGTGRGLALLLIAGAGIIGGLLANKTRMASWIILFLAGLGGFRIASLQIWVIPGTFLLLGTVFVLFGSIKNSTDPLDI
jgi:hypothetical protein